MSKNSTSKRARATVAISVLALGLGATGTAVAIADTGHERAEAPVSSSPAPSGADVSRAVTDAAYGNFQGGAAPTPVKPHLSPALRQQIIDELALLQRPATAADRVPGTVVPTGDPVSLIDPAIDLEFARKVPGAASTWLVPLRTGGLALIGSGGGAAYGPEQLDQGTVLLVSGGIEAPTTVTGIVADGVHDVSIKTAGGRLVPVEVTGNSFVTTFPAGNDASEAPAALVITDAAGTTTTQRLAGASIDAER